MTVTKFREAIKVFLVLKWEINNNYKVTNNNKKLNNTIHTTSIKSINS